MKTVPYWPRLMTAEQLCEHYGIPSPRTVRTMRQQGLAAVRLGKQYLFDPSDVEAFIKAKKTCPDRIEARDYTGSQIDKPSISSGMKQEKSAFGQLARQTAAKLKQRSSGSSAQVIAIAGRATPAK